MLILFIVIFVLATLAQTIHTSSYAARLAGVRTGQPTLAQSLYNVLTLGSRTAGLVLGPLLASITDIAVAEQNTATLLVVYRVLLLAATMGTLVAGLLTPTLSRVLARGVDSYGKRHSMPRVVVHAASVQGLWNIRHELTPPRLQVIRQSRRSPFPKYFLLASITATAISTVSSAAAMYASALAPHAPRTAASLSPLLAGGGLLLTIFIINPIAAQVVDGALQGRRPLKDVTYITVWQVSAQLLGTLVAQLLLQPTAWVMVVITHWLVA